MKKVGIVVDNYKLKKFKEELDKEGYADVKTFAFTATTTAITIHVEEAKVDTVKKFCQRLELHFKRSN